MTDQVIPESAVEAAHKAWRDQAQQDGTIFEYNLRAAIEAAAPHIRAQAMRDAAKTFGECEPEGSYSSTPTQVIDWLKDYAEVQ